MTPDSITNAPPPRMIAYDLISMPDMPFYDEMKPYLTDAGKKLILDLPYNEMLKVERWWKRINKRCRCCGK